MGDPNTGNPGLGTGVYPERPTFIEPRSFKRKIAQVWFGATFQYGLDKVQVRQNMKAFSIHITAAALLLAGLAGCAGASAAKPPVNPAVDNAAQPAKKNALPQKRRCAHSAQSKNSRATSAKLRKNRRRKCAALPAEWSATPHQRAGYCR